MSDTITIAYLRRSCDEKNKQIQSIPKQKEWCAETAKRLAVQIDHTFVDTRSAKEPGRPEFNRMMQKIELSDKPVRILTWRISRLARNPIDEGRVKYAFIQGKIIHIHAGDREYKQGANQILMGVDFGEATQKSIDLSKDVTEGMLKKIQKGWRPTYASLGYLNDPYGLKGEKKILKDPQRWDQVKKAWEMLLSGAYNVSEIKNWLDDSGFRTRRGRLVSLSTLYSRVFSNVFYTGFYEWNGNLEQGKHPSMISLDEFDRAQVILGRKEKSRNKKHEHAYTGLIRCAECGCMITAEPLKYKQNRKTGTVRTYQYMRCTKKNQSIHCSQKYIRMDALENQIDSILKSIEIPEALAEWAINELREENRNKTKEFITHRAQCQREYNENKAMIENLTDKFVRDAISEETYRTSLQRYETRRKELKKQMARYEQDKEGWLDRLDKDFNFAVTARERFSNSDLKTKRQIFSELGSNYFLKDGIVGLDLDEILFAIQRGKEIARDKFPQNEILSNVMDKPKIDIPESQIPIWSTWLHATRTFLPTLT